MFNFHFKLIFFVLVIFESNQLGSELSSESITEEIVKEARQKLILLEEESKCIQARFSCIHKDC